MTKPEDLWQHALDAFEPHRRKDPTAQDALNRIAAKCLEVFFDPSNSDIHHETIPFEKLTLLKTHHNKTSPSTGYEQQEPIVVLQVNEERYVIDGNKRVNRWVSDGDQRPRSAIVITRR